MKKWEYLVFVIRNDTLFKGKKVITDLRESKEMPIEFPWRFKMVLSENLCFFGELGWELIDFYPQSECKFMCVFKRRVLTKKDIKKFRKDEKLMKKFDNLEAALKSAWEDSQTEE